ncbi:protein phosphatase regulator pig1 [Naganishia cerealis]|uniref:Protein phosphatase regulator pig1 n=1 Tax=Naganishia cerealis TaxID=610337 RepID=A0ACC2VZZ1_9TREE|nr:protein phosphatase regulator pig1 [Naganishia cerealis]
MSTDKITVLLNWHATAYHAPIFLAKALGYFEEEGIKVAILEPNDPSDVTELIGTGYGQLGAKAMIHTIAGKARGFPIKSIGTLMDEPFTGALYLKGSGVSQDFTSLKGKRLGYVGEFGKIQIDELTKYYGMKPEDYTSVRCGMNISKALIEGKIDAGIGLENIQQVELEEWCKANGRPASDVGMMRIDELAELGCCCFCSILLIDWIDAHPTETAAFMKAVKRGADYMFADPIAAWAKYCDSKFDRSFNYMSRDLANVMRDWKKVTNYCKRLGIVGSDFKMNMTNEFLDWKLEDQDAIDGELKQTEMVCKQRGIAQSGGVLAIAGKIPVPV